MAIKKEHEWILDELKELAKQGNIKRPRRRPSKGYARFPISFSIEGSFEDYGVIDNGVRFKAYADYHAGGGKKGIVLIDNPTRKKATENQLQKTLKDPKYITYRKTMTDALATALIAFSKQHLSNVNEDSDELLWMKYNEFRELYTRYEQYNTIWFFISDQLVVEITKRLKGIDVEDIQTLLAPPFRSFITEERLAVLRAAAQKDTTQAKQIAEQFHWIPWGHIGPELYDEEYYKKQIELHQDLQPEREIQDILDRENELKNKQAAISKKYRVDDETLRLINDFFILAEIQDERKRVVAESHIPWVQGLMSEIGRRVGETQDQIIRVKPEDIELALIHKDTSLPEFTKRKGRKMDFCINERGRYTDYLDEDAKPFIDLILSADNTKNFRGKGASPGTAKGTVRILYDATENDRVKEGDILVTSMTTPDFVPAMRRAAGIITNEGGVTCHAAIVSRELGIPCIIGTEVATTALKEGEVIEMNGTDGSIKRT